MEQQRADHCPCRSILWMGHVLAPIGARQANLRARLQRTIRASRERVQAMQRHVQWRATSGVFVPLRSSVLGVSCFWASTLRRRVEREEQQVKHRFEACFKGNGRMACSKSGARWRCKPAMDSKEASRRFCSCLLEHWWPVKMSHMDGFAMQKKPRGFQIVSIVYLMAS